MASLDYISVPSCATRLQSDGGIRPAPKILTSLPHPSPDDFASEPSPVLSPSKTFNLLPSILLSSALPAGPNTAASPRRSGKKNERERLLSTREPLSIPITSVNFKRFVETVGPVFWLQDRVEEIVMWRRGWKLTVAWMAAYSFLCGYRWYPGL